MARERWPEPSVVMVSPVCGLSPTPVLSAAARGRDWRYWGDLERPLAVSAPGNSPELGPGGAACEGASRAVQIWPCLAADLVRERLLRERFVPPEPLGTTTQPSIPLPPGHPISCQALLTCLPHSYPPIWARRWQIDPPKCVWAQSPVSGMVPGGCLGRGQGQCHHSGILLAGPPMPQDSGDDDKRLSLAAVAVGRSHLDLSVLPTLEGCCEKSLSQLPWESPSGSTGTG